MHQHIFAEWFAPPKGFGIPLSAQTEGAGHQWVPMWDYLGHDSIAFHWFHGILRARLLHTIWLVWHTVQWFWTGQSCLPDILYNVCLDLRLKRFLILYHWFVEWHTLYNMCAREGVCRCIGLDVDDFDAACVDSGVEIRRLAPCKSCPAEGSGDDKPPVKRRVWVYPLRPAEAATVLGCRCGSAILTALIQRKWWRKLQILSIRKWALKWLTCNQYTVGHERDFKTRVPLYQVTAVYRQL